MLPPRPLSDPDTDEIICDVGAMRADLATIEALARMRLSAGRRGGTLRLRGASSELAQLVVFCGLGDVLPCEPLLQGPLGQAEEREHTRGVEERVDRGDAPT